MSQQRDKEAPQEHKPLELGAVLQTVCSKCGVKGHMANGITIEIVYLLYKSVTIKEARNMNFYKNLKSQRFGQRRKYSLPCDVDHTILKFQLIFAGLRSERRKKRRRNTKKIKNIKRRRSLRNRNPLPVHLPTRIKSDNNKFVTQFIRYRSGH